jgi:hypothetical protein
LQPSPQTPPGPPGAGNPAEPPPLQDPKAAITQRAVVIAPSIVRERSIVTSFPLAAILAAQRARRDGRKIDHLEDALARAVAGRTTTTPVALPQWQVLGSGTVHLPATQRAGDTQCAPVSAVLHEAPSAAAAAHLPPKGALHVPLAGHTA